MLAQRRTRIRAAGALDDGAQHVAPRDRVIREQATRPKHGPLITDHRQRTLGVLQEVRIPRHGWNPGPMREHVPDRGRVLAVASELGQVVGDPVLDVEHAELVELED